MAAGVAAVATLMVGTAAAVTVPPASAGSARDHTPAGAARVVAEERVGERILDLIVWSPALGRTAKARLLTPDGWEPRRRGGRWPVLYLLHAATDTYQTWTQESDVEELPELRDVLVVMPDGGHAGWYSNWWNNGDGGPPAWERFHLDELPKLLERGYRAGTRRAIAGLSMGGYGAVSYAARRPGMFRAAASYSGPVHPLHPSFLAVVPVLEQALGIDFGQIWGDPVAQRRIWQAHDPYHLARRLRHTPVFLACGDGTPGPLDPPGSEFDPAEAVNNQLNRSLAARLGSVGVPLTTDFTAGTHHPAYAERGLHRSLPILLDALQPRINGPDHQQAGVPPQ